MKAHKKIFGKKCSLIRGGGSSSDGLGVVPTQFGGRIPNYFYPNSWKTCCDSDPPDYGVELPLATQILNVVNECCHCFISCYNE